jgi:hypothetical protein
MRTRRLIEGTQLHYVWSYRERRRRHVKLPMKRSFSSSNGLKRKIKPTRLDFVVLNVREGVNVFGRLDRQPTVQNENFFALICSVYTQCQMNLHEQFFFTRRRIFFRMVLSKLLPGNVLHNVCFKLWMSNNKILIIETMLSCFYCSKCRQTGRHFLCSFVVNF